MKCGKCEQYSRSLGRCRLGKANPPTIKGCVEAWRMMGPGYLCVIDEENRTKYAKAQKRLLQ